MFFYVLVIDIVWDMHWASQLKLNQISAVSMDPNGNIAIFHRGDRIWDSNSFDKENRFNPDIGPISQNTIVLLNKSGKIILQLGKDMFFLPHGLTIDQLGNYWITDVAMHQVFKFDAEDIEKHIGELTNAQFNTNKLETNVPNYYRTNVSFENSILTPSLILGEAFEPGNDRTRFCKPTAVAVHSNGDFFVSDGYCNSRIIKFDKNGEQILLWGRHWGFGGNHKTNILMLFVCKRISYQEIEIKYLIYFRASLFAVATIERISSSTCFSNRQ